MAKADMFVEKRNHPRVSLQIPLKYRLIEDSQGMGTISELRKKELPSKTMDASLGGMFIVADERLNIGSILALNFSLPENPQKVSAFAEVVWSNENGGGIHFLALKDEDLTCLKNTLSAVYSA